MWQTWKPKTSKANETLQRLFGSEGRILENKFAEYLLVAGFNPLKHISQIGSFPQVGVKIKHIWNHHLV